MVTVFRINATDEIVGKTQNTRNGFRHVVEYQRNNQVIESRSVSYLNRTWESYEYETAIRALLEKMKMSKTEAEKILAITSGQAKADLDSKFGAIAGVAMMGEIMAGDKKSDKNKWKLRMIKAGLGESFQVPDDWDSLSEDEKEKRLNKIIEHMKK